MRRPNQELFPRPRHLTDRSDPAVFYVRSYLLIRTVVGVIGILLPVILVLGESWARGGGVRVGGSLSSYYYTSMRDAFVGTLCVLAVLLATYLAGQPWTWDFRLSLAAGVALLGVVFFPVGRPGTPPGALKCGSSPAPAGCSPLTRLLDQTLTEQIHLIAAGACFLLLSALSFLFARRERAQGGNVAARFHVACAVLILLGIGTAVVGSFHDSDLGPFPLLYVAESTTVWAFAASWLVAGRTLWLRLLRPRRGPLTTNPACPSPGEVPSDPGPVRAPDGAPAGQPAGWYRDPYLVETYRLRERWFDGWSWTAATRTVSGPSSGYGLAGLSMQECHIPWGAPPPAGYPGPDQPPPSSY